MSIEEYTNKQLKVFRKDKTAKDYGMSLMT